MTKFIFLIIPILLLVSCKQTNNNSNSKNRENQALAEAPAKAEHIYWHNKQIIEQVLKETDSVYIVHIGIMAQAFRLEHRNSPHFEKDLNLLKESLAKRIKLDIGIENGSGRILTVRYSALDIE